MKIAIESHDNDDEITINGVPISKNAEPNFLGLAAFILEMANGNYGILPRNCDRKITLIKAYRQISGCGLKEARDEVYKIIDYVPERDNTYYKTNRNTFSNVVRSNTIKDATKDPSWPDFVLFVKGHGEYDGKFDNDVH